ncbi:GNAT family N-acetyltransferase [Kutzneria buriramensis]|uniref:Putative GNAT family acetyltransferase n=1 Tax=Kutzneria buriramensis TaxID=1045776 RepID=A0A3E0IB54_9PSEU|nr:GNAT family N-acetyltransferase [Kutzneria buriramensis]REH55964.1 putative GNAT family acetyltransferase [Kutzneria buriramensis]
MRTPDDIVDLLVGFACRQATDVVEVPGGVAVRHREFPDSYNNNRLLIREAADPAAVLAAADDVMRDLNYRVIVFLDDEAGRAFEPAAREAGYEPHPLVAMRFEGETPPAPEIPVESLDLPVMTEALRRQWRRDEPGLPEDEVEQLATRVRDRRKGAEEVLFLGVIKDGEPVSWADFYRHKGIAQIEYVKTMPDHRGHGYSTAIMREALRRAKGCETVFLFADAADWPRNWYGRLRFTPVGRFHEFARTT